MLKSSKHVFWEALIVTIVVFLIGFFLGMVIETRNSEDIGNLYLKSEITLVDGMAVTQLSESHGFSCDSIKKENIAFADRVYEEAKLLDKYEESKTLTDGTNFLHTKYDLLRTLLWMSNQKSLNRCDNYNLIVYLYAHETKDSDIQASQNVWSKFLGDLKASKENILLLPIAADQNLTSLNLLIAEFNITKFPAVVFNNKEVILSIDNLKKLREKIT